MQLAALYLCGWFWLEICPGRSSTRMTLVVIGLETLGNTTNGWCLRGGDCRPPNPRWAQIGNLNTAEGGVPFIVRPLVSSFLSSCTFIPIFPFSGILELRSMFGGEHNHDDAPPRSAPSNPGFSSINRLARGIDYVAASVRGAP